MSELDEWLNDQTGTGWGVPTRTLTLGDPNGTHIVLDGQNGQILVYNALNELVASLTAVGNLGTFRLWDNGSIVGELTSTLDAFDLAFRLSAEGDTNARFFIRAEGGMFWGPGNAFENTNLYRSGVLMLKTDAGFTVALGFVAEGTATFGDVATFNAAAIFNDVTSFLDTITAVDIDADLISVAGDLVTASQNGVNGVATTVGTDTTTSAAYVNMAGTGSQTSFSFTKRFSATRIKMDVRASMYVPANVSNVFVGVNINATDYDIYQIPVLVNTRIIGSAVRYISGVPAGTYTVQARWRRVSGTGTLTRDTADWLSMSAEEVN